jgi:hypothetical protein
MSPLEAPRNDLAGFPSWTVQPGTALARIHGAGRSPWWFSRDGSGRFDLCTLPRGGTCYLAEQELGAYVEVFRDLCLVAESELEERGTSFLTLDEPLRLADCTVSAARTFGVTGAIHSTERYDLTQAWARAFSLEAFHGVRYRISHDPEQSLIGVALFGEGYDAATRSRPIAPAVVAEAEARFGIRVRPAPTGPLVFKAPV